MKNKKDIVSLLINSFTILLVLVANGLLSFIGLGFNFDVLKTSAYWVKFFSNGISAMLVYISAKNMSNQRFLKSKTITDEIDSIINNREIVESNQRTKEARAWIDTYFNPMQKLESYKGHINKKLNKLKLSKPDKNIIIIPKVERRFKHYFVLPFIYIHNTFSSMRYFFKSRKYNKEKKRQAYYYQQLDFCDKHNQLLEMIVSKNKDENKIKELIEITNSTEYNINNNKLDYESITWSTLVTSNYEEEYNQKAKLRFNAKKENLKDIPKMLVSMLLFNMVMTALYPELYKDKITLAIIFQFVMFAIWLLTFTIKAINKSSKMIKGQYYRSLKERNRVFSELVKDIGVYKIEFLEDDEIEEG